MAFEIERKFLVKGDAWRGLAEPVRIRQGYMAFSQERCLSTYFVHEKSRMTVP